MPDAMAALMRLRDRQHGTGYAGDPVADIAELEEHIAAQRALLAEWLAVHDEEWHHSPGMEECARMAAEGDSQCSLAERARRLIGNT